MLATIASFIISPNLLFALGIGYSESEGSQFLKVHPATYFYAAIFMGAVLFRLKNRAHFVSNRALRNCIAGGVGLCVYCLAMRYSVSVVAVSLLTPLLALHVAQRLPGKAMRLLYRTLRLLVLANSVVGIYEILDGSTMLPRVAGGILIETEQRAIGIVGHALPSSMLAGLTALYLLYRVLYSVALNVRSRTLITGELLIHLAALIAFGSRLVIVITAFFAVWIILFGPRGTSKSGSTTVRRILILVVLVASTWLLATADFSQSTIDRFLGGQGAAASTESRLAAFALLTTLAPSEWLWGINATRRVELMELFDTNFGIEVTWIAWILSFGVVWTILATYALFSLLFKILSRNPVPHKYLVFFFIIGISGSQGLGGKTMLLTWVLLMLITYPVQAGALTRRV
ncbi:hypothetical protein WG902_12060 [Ramlibacter sp. PS3R-8]|uniref:hypothetical protein n=1 Tax=Ramlibacter sp. PS3R-8 TaxID=3133437 RepID=UPI0030972CD6